MTFSVREVSLGEVCEIKQGRYLAPNQMEPTPTNECFVPVIGGNGVLGFTNQSTFPFPVPLVTCRGSKCGLMQWAEPPTWISNNAMAVYFKENQGDNFFLHQYLLNSSFDDVTTGSAQPQITVTNLSLKQILLPDLQTQKTISLIMKNIEGKVAANNALSKTLEDIAQTIFKSWFIDFDPVKAKMAGEMPVGMDKTKRVENS
jgi:type I restriction enzyme, S subunit